MQDVLLFATHLLLPAKKKTQHGFNADQLHTNTWMHVLVLRFFNLYKKNHWKLNIKNLNNTSVWHYFSPMILTLLFWLKYERHSGNLPIKLVYYLFYIIFGWKYCFLIIPRFHFQIYERGLNENHWWPGSKSQKQPSWIVYPQRENLYQRLVSKS